MSDNGSFSEYSDLVSCLNELQTNIPTAVEKVNKVASKREGKSDETVSKPGRKKMKLGHSTKENRIEIIFNN